MGSLHGHITFYFVLALVLSSNHILAKAHKDFESEKIYNRIKLLIRKTQYPYIKRCLTGCSENYQDAIGLIKKSLAALDANGYADANIWIAALDSKRYSDASTWVGAATDWAETCEDIFAGKSHLTSMKNEFEKLVSIALAVIKKSAGN
uniref:Pectinesterase inhibitor domain-containing protein n=1 Tax=Populus trichocarpa TaxID=3694 RepID=B9N4K7_POPTR